LEDHGKATVFWVEVRDLSLADVNLAIIDLQQSCQNVEQSCLTAAGGPKKYHEFAAIDFEIELLENGRRAVFLRNVAEFDSWHGLTF
jgi:hypothetical protein